MNTMTRFFFAIISFYFISSVANAGSFSYVEKGEWVTVGKVIDGDTFKTQQGKKIRLLGINTPEIPHRSKPGEVMGAEATQALKKLIAGKTVRLSFDRERKDRYQRLLAQVWLRDGRWVNGLLVEQGYAHVYTFVPNLRWANKLLALEKKAIAAKIGIWQTPRFSLLLATAVTKKNIGQFRLVDGRISSRLDKYGWYFKVGKLRVSVPKKYRKWFKQPPAINHQGNTVRLRGRIRTGNNGGLYLALHSPADLEWLL